MTRRLTMAVLGAAAVAAGAACSGMSATQTQPFASAVLADFDEPWAMAFLPDGRLLVTEKAGALKLFDPGSGAIGDVSGVPDVAYAGQGGFGDVVLHPEYASNDLVYLSYGEPAAGGTSAAVVARATLVLAAGGGRLENLEVIWRQRPAVRSNGHFGHRIAFGQGYLWISSGERQQGDPAQDLQSTLGKIVRLHDDGSVPEDNPFAGQGGVAAEIWSLGHRNPLGLAFDPDGRLWNVEMGPRGGDELNLVERGANYGWPTVSNGSEYSGAPIPDHGTRPDFRAPAAFWVPSISPSSLLFYTGSQFPEWRGNALVGALSGEALVRVEVDGATAREAERFDMGQRIRAVKQAPDGAIWVLEDGGRGSSGRLLTLTPAR